MRTPLASWLVALTLVAAPSSRANLQTAGLTPPVAQKIPKDVTVHGDKRIDDYFWLRYRENPAVIDYLRSEDAYTESVMAQTKPLQEMLYKEMLGRIQETDSTAPFPDGKWLYYSRTQAGLQYPIYCRRPNRAGAKQAEEVVIDLNAVAGAGKFIGLGDYVVSDDGNLAAYSLDRTGHRDYVLSVKDLRTGKDIPITVGTASSVEWSSDNRTLFYTKEDSVSKRSYRLGRYDLKTGENTVLWDEKDEIFDIGLDRSDDRKFIFCTSESKLTTEVRAIPADTPGAAWQVLSPRVPNQKYFAEHRGGLFYIVTNKNAENYKVVTAPVATPDDRHWTDFLPARTEVKVESIALFAKYAVVSERQDGLPQIRVIDFASGQAHRITFPEPSYDAGLSHNAEYNTDILRFSYQSPVTAPSVFAYDMGARTRTLVKQNAVLGGYDPKDYACERLMAKASDGTAIPITIVYRRSLRTKGPQKLLLYGYGSYGVSEPDSFSPIRLSLLDRGVIYAIAHVRGGGELGEPWREAGRMKNKMTTFTDFISCAQYLETNGYTSPQMMATSGGSAGGLLMGAILNLNPGLFKCAVLKVPFVDVVNTMLDASLPLTTDEYIEWGNPNVAEEYGWIRAYSPYDNIKAQAYPAILVTTALNDSQVPYWEGCKYVAKLRATKTDSNPLLLKINLDPAGHGGASGRYDRLREASFDYSFALTELD